MPALLLVIGAMTGWHASAVAASTTASTNASSTTPLTSRLAAPSVCATTPSTTAAQQDRLLRFAAIVRRELEASGARLAIVARNGTNLRRFGIRYSHAGLALARNPHGAWAVRQLYYDCEGARPRVYDQGIAGFVSGTDEPATPYLSMLLLPPGDEPPIEAAALDDDRARSLLGTTYSANAYVWSTLHQNCNQWLMELLASAWGAPATPSPRDGAQRWLAGQHYAPAPVDVGSHALMLVAPFIPMLRWHDHPIDDLHALRVRTTLPASIEGFVRARIPGASRVELCHDDRRVVIRRDGQPLPEGCVPGNGDRVVAFD
jgi:hypothetical protein